MSDVLILTGACGAGKTTVSKEWAIKKKGAAVECDYFTEWIYDDRFLRFTFEEELLVARISLNAAKEYLKLSIPVAVENVWTPIGIEYLHKEFSRLETVDRIRFVWLRCSINENHRRDRLRIPENIMGERVDIVNDQLNSYIWQDYVNIIDNTFLNVKETISEIEKL
ncbi:MAG: hypothetical protein JSS91_08605 [Bacteroidetes bacterium]|nr:hypothetical protein [Bacteroidota bacterium]